MATTEMTLATARTAYVGTLHNLSAQAATVAGVGPTIWDQALQDALTTTEDARRAYLEAYRADREAYLRRTLPLAE
jgi:hypothetical protein